MLSPTSQRFVSTYALRNKSFSIILKFLNWICMRSEVFFFFLSNMEMFRYSSQLFKKSIFHIILSFLLCHRTVGCYFSFCVIMNNLSYFWLITVFYITALHWDLMSDFQCWQKLFTSFVLETQVLLCLPINYRSILSISIK